MPFFVSKKGNMMNLNNHNLSLKQKLKKAGLALTCLMAASVGLNSIDTVKADNAQMTDLPKGTNAQSNKIAGQYAFAGAVSAGQTKVSPFGAKNSDWATSTSRTEEKTKHWYAFKLSDTRGNNDDWKGKIGAYYSNIGTYKGHIIDLKVTVLNWKVQNYNWVVSSADEHGVNEIKVKDDNAYIAFGKDDFEIFTPGMGAVKYRLDYIDHDTHEPIKLTA